MVNKLVFIVHISYSSTMSSTRHPSELQRSVYQFLVVILSNFVVLHVSQLAFYSRSKRLLLLYVFSFQFLEAFEISAVVQK